MGYASRSGRHDNALAAPAKITREELIQAQVYVLQRHPADISAAIVAGGMTKYVALALFADEVGLTRAEYEEVFRRLSRGSILTDGAEPDMARDLVATTCRN